MNRAFQVHFIAMTNPSHRQKVRMLWVATSGTSVVYEGLKSWSRCIRCLKQLPQVEIASSEWMRVKELFDRDQYATLHEVKASPCDPESIGLERADR
jgi:hypothetical protein